jgi:hypothetical protein
MASTTATPAAVEMDDTDAWTDESPGLDAAAALAALTDPDCREMLAAAAGGTDRQGTHR